MGFDLEWLDSSRGGGGAGGGDILCNLFLGIVIP